MQPWTYSHHGSFLKIAEWPEIPDCVKMKHGIQEALEEEYRGLTDEERNRRIVEKIRANPVLGPLWERLPRIQPQAPANVAKASESPASYGLE